MSQGQEITPQANRTDTAPPSNIWRLVSRFMVPVVLIVFAAPFLVLLFYSVPAADDFCLATLAYGGVPQSSVLSITWMYYTRWSPRWLTYLLLSAVTSHVDLAAAYGWLLLIVVLTNLAALWYFFRTAFRLTRPTSFVVAAVFYAAWIASIANPDEQFYWLTNVVVYNLPLSTLLVLVSLLLRPRRAVWYYVTISLLSIAVPAQHEIVGTFLCVVLVAGTVAMRLKKLPAGHWYLTLGMTAVSYAAVMLSPGNAARAAQEHKRLWDIAHFPRWIAHSFYHGFNWLSVPAILVAACCIFLLLQCGMEKQTTCDPRPSWLGIAGLCAMFVVLCECSLVEMSTSTWLPPRLVSCFEFIFWLLFVCVILTGIPELYETHFSLSTGIGVFALLAVTLLGSSNYRAAVADLRGPAQSWWRVDTSRLKQRGGSLVFEGPTRYPRLAKPQMLTDDPTCWVNRCMANYLQATTVVVKNSNDKCP